MRSPTASSPSTPRSSGFRGLRHRPGDAADLMDLLRDDHGLTNDAGQRKQGRLRGPPPWPTSTRARSIPAVRPRRHRRRLPLVRAARRRRSCCCSRTLSPASAPGAAGFRRSAARLAGAAEPAGDRRAAGRAGGITCWWTSTRTSIRSRSTSCRAAAAGRGLTVVGDDAQAVYGFRGATSGHLLDVAAAFRRRAIVRLERNFRSRQPVLDLANVIRPGRRRDGRLTLHADRAGRRGGRG